MRLTFWMCLALLLYVHVGYALLIAVVARFSRKPGPEVGTTRWPSVTLVIPAYNEEAVIRQKIENSLRLDYPGPLQIVVVSDGSTDKTNEIVQSYGPRVSFIALSHRTGKIAVLCRAVRLTHGEVLALCDANAMMAKDALRRLVAWLAKPGVGAATGEVRIATHESDFGLSESFYCRIERIIQEAESRCGSVIGVDGAMYVVRRELFKEPSADTVLDDFSISMTVLRKGYRVIYDPAAKGYENATPSANQEFVRRVRIAAGAMQAVMRGYLPRVGQPFLLWQYFSHKFLRWITPLLLLLLFFSTTALARSSSFYASILLGQILVYLLALVGWRSPAIRQIPVINLVFYFVMSYTATLFGLVRGIRKRQAVTWEKADRAQWE